MTQAMHGMIARRRGNRDKALSLLSASLEQNSKQPMVLLERALARRHDADTIAEAIEDTTRALELNPDMPQARYLLAQLQLRRGNGSEARSALRTLLSRNPGQKEARLQLVRLLLNNNDPAGARSLLNDAMERFPEDPTWPRRLARLAASQGRMDRAIEAWRQTVALAASPGHLAGLGTALLRADRAEAVESLLTEHAGTVNESPRLQALRARALAKAGRRKAATNLFRRAMSRADTAAEARSVAQQMSQGIGLSEAISQLSDLEQTANDAYTSLAIAQLQMAARRHGPALARLRQAESALGDGANEGVRLQITQMKATCLQQTGQREQARQHYERVLEQEPGNVNALNNLAYLLTVEFDEPDRAVELAQRAANQTEDNGQILDTLGWAQFKAGQPHEARLTLQRSIELEPMPYNHLHLGRVFMDLDVPVRARELLNKASQLAEESDNAEVARQAQQWLKELSKLSQQENQPQG